MTNDKEYLTKEKYEEFKNELEDLKKNRRKEVAEHLGYARSLGDLSENAEYQEAREEQASVESRIAHLEDILKNTEIVSSHHSDYVEVGSTVTVEKTDNKEQKTFDIVGSEEADIDKNKLSINAPIVEAMAGKKEGDTFTFSIPSGDVTYKIVKIK